MKHFIIMIILLLSRSIFALSQPYSEERLSRGLIGIPIEKGMYFSWRITLEDAPDLRFDLYRSSNGGAQVKLNKEPISKTSDFLDNTVDFAVENQWTLKSSRGEVTTWRRPKNEKQNPYLSIPISKPKDGEIANEHFAYMANDCSVGDLDGDGEYEIILKWSPSNSKDHHNAVLQEIPTWMHIKWMEHSCGVLTWDRMCVPEQQPPISWSLILTVTGVPKFVARQEMEL